MQHWLGLQIVLVKTLHLVVCFPHFLFYCLSFWTGWQCVLFCRSPSAFSLVVFLLPIPYLIYCQHSDGDFLCTCSALSKLSLHYYHWMLCAHNGTLLIIILSDGFCNASSCINYCDCCVHYADYFKRGRKLTLDHRTLTHDLDVENGQTCQQEDYFAAYVVVNLSHSLYFFCQNSEAFQAQVLCQWPYRGRQRRCVEVCI